MTDFAALKRQVLVPSRGRFWFLSCTTVLVSFFAGLVMSVELPTPGSEEVLDARNAMADEQGCTSGYAPCERTWIQATLFASLMEEPAESERLTYAALAHFVPEYGESGMRGVRVEDLRPNTPLSLLGLKNGDVIDSVDGVPLRSLESLWGMHRLLQTPEPGTMRFELRRDDCPITIHATLL